MSHDLYFIPVLAKALSKADVQKSLDNAFYLIERLGHQRLYAEGYHNFRRFMSELFARRQLLEEQTVRTAMLNHIESTFTETKVCALLEQIQKDKSHRFRQEYEALCREFELCTEKTLIPTIRVLYNGREFQQVSFAKRPGRRMVYEISPGHYTLKLDSGLVIWEGRLNASDLMWKQAFGEKDLELAAETVEIHRRPVREIQVPDAAMILQTFAGLEVGSLGIELIR